MVLWHSVTFSGIFMTYYLCGMFAMAGTLSDASSYNWTSDAVRTMSTFCYHWARWPQHWPVKRPVCAESLFLMTRRIVESVLLTRRVIAESPVFAKSVLPSQFLRLTLTCRLSSSLTDSLLMWTLTAAVAEGPRDAESWFRAETYYIRIIKVSPILLSQILLSLTRRVIADLDFVYSRVCMCV